VTEHKAPVRVTPTDDERPGQLDPAGIQFPAEPLRERGSTTGIEPRVRGREQSGRP
jgi:hypothetical protein